VQHVREVLGALGVAAALLVHLLAGAP